MTKVKIGGEHKVASVRRLGQIEANEEYAEMSTRKLVKKR